MPVTGERFFNISVIASKPPADAPMATIGNKPFFFTDLTEFTDLGMFFPITYFRFVNYSLLKVINLESRYKKKYHQFSTYKQAVFQNLQSVAEGLIFEYMYVQRIKLMYGKDHHCYDN
jgi:hypothetical protein